MVQVIEWKLMPWKLENYAYNMLKRKYRSCKHVVLHVYIGKTWFWKILYFLKNIYSGVCVPWLRLLESLRWWLALGKRGLSAASRVAGRDDWCFACEVFKARGWTCTGWQVWPQKKGKCTWGANPKWYSDFFWGLVSAVLLGDWQVTQHFQEPVLHQLGPGGVVLLQLRTAGEVWSNPLTKSWPHIAQALFVFDFSSSTSYGSFLII